ncbi:MAG: N-acetylmuramoyl-L-alanine amidase [Alphaproteobacteria bacterium]|nr:N-acetylmuramoyl-L-alanine amidase [Alphaproteobacteria bacterium]MDE2336717.1 N-acetylmuramoyl-L-alanine amidase [Alphaproteobacteria bacterium]
MLLPVTLYAAVSSRLQIDGIRFGFSGNDTRVVLDLNHKTKFRAFLLDRPYRLVLDLPPVRWKTFKARFIENNSALKSYRSGTLANGLTRIIFDLEKPAVIRDLFTLPASDMEKNRLVIDLSPCSEATFSAEKDNVIGKRDLAPPAGAAAAADADSYAADQDKAVRAADPGTEQSPPPAVFGQNKKYVVVLDPGHGGHDPGAEDNGVEEKYLTLAMAKEVKRELEATGRYKVYLTRDRDVYVTLQERVEMSRRVHADLFVSIHANKYDRSDVRGALIFSFSEKASDKETQLLADSENNAGYIAGVDMSAQSPDVANILIDLAMREKMNESNLFANLLIRSFEQRGVRLLMPHPHRSANFVVLRAPDVPAVLIETGFISNPREAQLLDTNAFHRRLAAAIVSGINAYFRKMVALQSH